MRSDLPPDTLRTLSLSLTLSRWMPLAPQAPLGNTLSDSRNSLLASRISGSHSRLITSAPTPLSPSPLTPFDSEIRDNSVARTRHATDRFPRFTYLLLRNGTLQSESDEGRSRRSADPEGTRASLWPLPVAPAQCGIRDETGLQSCAAASGSGTCSLAEHSSSPSRASITSASDPVEPLASALESTQLWLLPVVSPSGKAAMSTYPGATSSSSRGGTRTGNEQQQVLAPTPTRRGLIVSRVNASRLETHTSDTPRKARPPTRRGATTMPMRTTTTSRDRRGVRETASSPRRRRRAGRGSPLPARDACSARSGGSLRRRRRRPNASLSPSVYVCIAHRGLSARTIVRDS